MPMFWIRFADASVAVLEADSQAAALKAAAALGPVTDQVRSAQLGRNVHAGWLGRLLTGAELDLMCAAPSEGPPRAAATPLPPADEPAPATKPRRR